MNSFFINKALKIANEKPCPDRIPRTGDEGDKQDCVLIYLRSIDTSKATFQDMIFDRLVGKIPIGRNWNEQEKKYGSDCSVITSTLSEFRTEITHYRGRYEFQYKSARKFLFRYWFGLEFAAIFWEKAKQLFFNSKTPKRADRTRIISTMINHKRHHLTENTHQNYEGLMSTSWLSEIHGKRIWRHPNFPSLHADLKMHLESLETNKIVTKNDLAYQITGKALSTLATIEEEDRRHKDQLINNRLLVFFTLALVVVGGIQAWITYTLSS